MNSITPTRLTTDSVTRLSSLRNAVSAPSCWPRLAAFLAISVIGCSDGRPPLYPVSGTVSFESGDPVRNASIEFVPSQPAPSPRGRIDAGGRFTLGTYETQDGAPEGTYRVVVVQALPPGAAAGIRTLGEEHAGHAGSVRVVALKHASPDTSEITCVVEPIPQNETTIVVEAR